MVGNILAAGGVDDDDALQAAHLGGGDAHGARPGAQGLLEIGDEGMQGIVDGGHRLRGLLEARIGPDKDVEHSHGSGLSR